MTLESDVISAIEESGAWIPEIGKGTGWRPEEPDARDFRLKTLLGAPAPALVGEAEETQYPSRGAPVL